VSVSRERIVRTMTGRAALKLGIGKGLLLVAVGSVGLAAPNLSGQRNITPGVAHLSGESAAAGTPMYDVASIKLSKYTSDGGTMMVMMRTDPDGMTATNVTLKSLVCMAYGLSDYQVSGGPGWVDSDYYDVNAKMDDSTMEMLGKLAPGQAQLMRQQMLQAVLAERFKLTIHRETKQVPVFTLVVAKSGPKMHPSAPTTAAADGNNGPNGQRPQGMMRMGWETDAMTLTAEGISMEGFTPQLAGMLRSTVENKTGLKGNYDFTLRYTPDEVRDAMNSSSFAPPIFAAVQEQLGLKLESRKGLSEALVIDQVERPSAN